MIGRLLAQRGSLENRRAAGSARPGRVARLAEHLACSLFSVLQPARERLGVDPLSGAAGNARRYCPVPIDRLKVAGPVREQILRQRRPSASLETSDSKRLAVIVPYRDRPQQLAALLEALHGTLSRQGIDYLIVVAEQSDSGLFNRGAMKNVGADLVADWCDYYCFHDVDNIPEHADYRCPSQPMRLVHRYTRTYRRDNPIRGYFFGAVVSMQRAHFQAINGYDNRYWGWGQEDEDLFLCCLLAGMTPFVDTHGVFREFENPRVELSERSFLIRRRNRYLMKAGMTRNAIGGSGLSDLDYKVVGQSRSGRVLHVVAAI